MIFTDRPLKYGTTKHFLGDMMFHFLRCLYYYLSKLLEPTSSSTIRKHVWHARVELGYSLGADSTLVYTRMPVTHDQVPVNADSCTQIHYLHMQLGCFSSE